MEKVLNLLSTLQEKAESKRVYDLDTKVQRMMDLMGFEIRQEKTFRRDVCTVDVVLSTQFLK